MKIKIYRICSEYNLIIAFIILVGFATVHSQNLQINSEVLSSFQANSAIGTMTPDPMANLWLADINTGSYKYDGEGFTHYSNERDNPNCLISNRLECLLTDSDGIIRIGSFARGLIRFNPVTEIYDPCKCDADDL